MNRSASDASSKEIAVNGTNRVRQFHRWVSIAFTVAVVVNLVALGKGQQAVWVGLLALLPLAVLQFTGLYLLVLPHAARWRSARRATERRPTA